MLAASVIAMMAWTLLRLKKLKKALCFFLLTTKRKQHVLLQPTMYSQRVNRSRIQGLPLGECSLEPLHASSNLSRLPNFGMNLNHLSGVVWCGVVCCAGVVCCGVVWCGVMCCAVLLCGVVVWCGVLCCAVVWWCGVVCWCGVVSCGVVWWCVVSCGVR